MGDKIGGGLADKLKPEDFPKDALLKGVKVELEHTDDPLIALEIAMDHLVEDLNYYDKLEVMKKNKNAKSLPQIYYGLHMEPGVAEYPEKDYMLYIDETALKKMDKTFAGKPVYVDHVEEVELDELETKADGYVVESFYNRLDGKHWVKFIVVSDKGKEKIANGWKLSNAYVPLEVGDGGEWHAVKYDQEVFDGEYEHLAIVKEPRYEKSVILTPEDFKAYNEQKEGELLKIANSKKTIKQGAAGMFKFFKRETVENSKELEEYAVILPKSKREVNLSKLVNEMDELEVAKEEPKAANEMDLVEINGEEMSVKDLCNKYNELVLELEEVKKKEEDVANESEEEDKKEENESEEKEEEMENEDEDEYVEEEVVESKKNKKKNFKSLKNAHKKGLGAFDDEVLELGFDKAARGKTRYGS